jgi:hypothetical protein
MKNVQMAVEGQRLTITVDLSKEFGPSASGTMIIIASTEGSVSVPERAEKVGLNVDRKKWRRRFWYRLDRDMDMQSWLEPAGAELQSLAQL